MAVIVMLERHVLSPPCPSAYFLVPGSTSPPSAHDVKVQPCNRLYSGDTLLAFYLSLPRVLTPNFSPAQHLTQGLLKSQLTVPVSLFW